MRRTAQFAFGDGQAERRLARPEEDLARAAELAKLLEQQSDDLPHPLVGIELDASVLAPAEAGRQREAKLAAAGLRVPCGEATLPEETELVLGHRAFQAEQQPVVHQARVVDAVRIDDQRAGHRAEIDQMMPVPPVARQPRRLKAEHGANGAGADLGHETLEARPGSTAQSRIGPGPRRSP